MKIEFLFDKQNDVMNFEEDNNTFQKELIYIYITIQVIYILFEYINILTYFSL